MIGCNKDILVIYVWIWTKIFDNYLKKYHPANGSASIYYEKRSNSLLPEIKTKIKGFTMDKKIANYGRKIPERLYSPQRDSS